MTFGWSCNSDAGNAVVNGPLIIPATDCAFVLPDAIRTMLRESKIVARPIDSASVGTRSTAPANSHAFEALVSSVKRVRCVLG